MTETPEQRSRTMRAVRSRDTGPELVVRRYLHAAGLRYRLHDRRLPGAPDLGRAAVDEVMRVAPTTTWTTREAIEDIEFQGVTIPRGTTVHLMSASASTDPAVYDPDRFDITVERERGVGFGGGIHHCLGHFVARTDMAEALPRLAQRLPRMRPDGEPTWLPLTGNTGPVTLPIAFG